MHELLIRMDKLISDCWISFAHKVGDERIIIGSRNSMLVHYTHLLKNTMDLVLYRKSEKVELMFDSVIENQNLEIENLLHLSDGKETSNIPFILRFSSGEDQDGLRQTEFRKGIYQDLMHLEKVSSHRRFESCYSLIMTDVRKLVINDENVKFPIAEGTHINSFKDKDTGIQLEKDYTFDWHKHGKFWFSLVQGI